MNLRKQFFFFHFLKFASLVFVNIAQDCSLGQCLTSSKAETSKKKKKMWPKLGPTRPKLRLKWGFLAFSSYFIKSQKISLNWYFKLVYYIEFFTYNSTASSFSYRLFELPWMELMSPMPFTKYWNLFCSNVVQSSYIVLLSFYTKRCQGFA